MSSLSGFILVLVGFGFLIFIHELGHFLAAKWAGIRADGFAIGMGPCLASYRKGIGFVFGSADAIATRRFGKRPLAMPDAERIEHGLGETEYSLRALPIGGYVRMLGQEDGDPSAVSDDARSFSRAAIPKRAVVILAGITANLILAIVLFLIAFLVGVRFPSPTVGFVEPNSAAALATPAQRASSIGLRSGDRVLSINGDEIKTYTDLRVATAMARPEQLLTIEIERDGAAMTYSATPQKDANNGLLTLGVDPAHSTMLTDVAESREIVTQAINAVSLDLAQAGVGPGARIEAVNGKPVTTFTQLSDAARASGGAPLRLTWKRAESPGATSAAASIDVSIDPLPDFQMLRSSDDAGSSVDLGLLGLVPLARVQAVVESSKNKDVVQEGDVFLRVGSLQGPRISEVMRAFRAAPNATIPALVRRHDVDTAIELTTDGDGRVGVYLESAFDLPWLARSIVEVLDISSDGAAAARATPAAALATPAAALDTIALSRLVSLDGAPLSSFIELRGALIARARIASQNAGAAAGALPDLTLHLGVQDPSPSASPVESTLTLTPHDSTALLALRDSFPISPSLFDPEFVVLSANGDPLKAIAMGFRQTVVMVEQVFLTIDRVSRGSVGVDQLQGPVGILHTGTQVASEGFMFMMFFLALISVNLAVVNLLPIPITDGGLFLFLMYERFVGKPPSIAFQNAAALAGIAFVAGLFLLTFFNDLGRLFG